MINKELKTKIIPSQALLVSLYHSSLNHKNEQYSELNLFRRKIEETKSGPHHRPYEARQSDSIMYRGIFAGLGVVFLLLTYFIYVQSLTWGYTMILGNSHMVKMLLCGISMTFSAAAFFVSYSIRPEKEAVYFIGSRAKKQLVTMFRKNQTSLGWKQILDMDKKILLRHAKDKVNEGMHVTIVLMKRIAKDPSLSKDEKIELYNQAVLELNDRLEHIIEDFGKALFSTDLQMN